MNTAKNKKYKHIAFNFSSTDVGLQEKAYNTEPLLIDGNKLRTLNLNYENFYCWGYFDVLTVILFDSIEKIIDLQKLSLLTQAYDHRYYYGRIISPRDFNLPEKVKEMPLIGISFIKFKNEATAYLKKDGIVYFIHHILKRKIDFWKKELQINDKEFLPVIILSYGWEDVILLMLSKSYEDIKRLVLKLRTLKFDNIKSCIDEEKLRYWKRYPKKQPKHLTVATWTIFANHLSYSKSIKNINQRRKDAFENLIKKIKEDKILVDSIKLQSRPGHLDWAIKKADEYKSYLEVPHPIIGRNDLNLKLKRPTFKSFLRTYYKIILPQLLIKTQSPIVSAETSFILNIKNNLEENIPCNKLKMGNLNLSLLRCSKDKNFIQDLLTNSTLPIHTTLAFANIFVAAIYLKDNFYTKSIMCSLVSFIKHLQIEFDEKLKVGGNELQEEITVLLEGLALSFIDRYRGIYPVGENSTLPLITYKGSFQKFLVSLDYLCNIIFLKAQNLTYRKITNIPLYQRAFSCYIGNAPAPCISSTRYINIGLINVPLKAVVNIKSLHYLFHEVGHSFWWSIFSLIPFQRKGYVPILFEDILSDYFEFMLCFKGDYATYEETFIQSLKTDFNMTEDDVKKHHELTIRFLAVKWLFERITNNKNNSVTFAKIFSKIYSLRKEIIDEFTTTINLLLYFLTKNKLFYKILEGLTEYRTTAVNQDEIENMIDKFRKCIREETTEYLFWLEVYKVALDFFKVGGNQKA